MSVSSQRGHIAWAIQKGKVGSLSATGFDPVTGSSGHLTTNWQKHRAESVTLGINELYDVLPLEVGGSLFVNSSYKNGAFVAGGARMFSRLESTFGYLLYALAGEAVAQTGAGATGSGWKTTRFQVKPTDETVMPWLALRKFTPASSGASGLSEYFVDCRVNMMTISVPAMGPAMIEFSVIGRMPEAANVAATGDGSATGDSGFENGTSLSHGCKGVITLEDFQGSGLPFATNADGKFTSAQIMIANNISQPDQQMIIGSYHPDDLTPLSRAVQIKLVYKWQDPKLYKKLYYGGSADTTNINWSPVVGNSPVTISSSSVTNIPSASVPYSFSFRAEDCDWTMTPPQLAGNNLLFCELTGIVKGGNNGTSTPTWYIDVVNNADYTTIL